MEKEFKGVKISGFIMIFVELIIICSSVLFMVKAVTEHIDSFIVLSIIMLILAIVFSVGFMVNEPNDIKVIKFFGKYSGTLKENGFFWVNPFYSRVKLTLRARNLDIEPIKVNDKTGNPVMIGLVLVWRVKDSYKAIFDIDSSPRKGSKTNDLSMNISERMASFHDFVSVQSNSALRNIASEYAYDNNDDINEVTLRSGGESIANRLEDELNNRLILAGIEVVEARINYLAYAPEIAAVMLRRQQASAIISAREKIVDGAVGMVRLALNKLSAENIIELDDDKKAAMVSNLLVVLCSEEHTQPIINTGTLNH